MPHDLFKKSRLFHSWSDRFVLRRYFRIDHAHFDLCLRLQDMDTHSAIDEACATYTWVVGDCDYHICLFHYRRKRLNEKRRRGSPPDIDCESEHDIFRGTKFIGTSYMHKPIVNGAFPRVTQVSLEVLKLEAENILAVRSSKLL